MIQFMKTMFIIIGWDCPNNDTSPGFPPRDTRIVQTSKTVQVAQGCKSRRAACFCRPARLALAAALALLLVARVSDPRGAQHGSVRAGWGETVVERGTVGSRKTPTHPTFTKTAAPPHHASGQGAAASARDRYGGFGLAGRAWRDVRVRVRLRSPRAAAAARTVRFGVISRSVLL